MMTKIIASLLIPILINICNSNAKCVFLHRGLTLECDSFDSFDEITDEQAKNVKYINIVHSNDSITELPDFSTKPWENVININLTKLKKLNCIDIVELKKVFPKIEGIGFSDCILTQNDPRICTNQTGQELPRKCHIIDDGFWMECTGTEDFESIHPPVVANVTVLSFKMESKMLPKLDYNTWKNLKHLNLELMPNVFCEDVINAGNEIKLDTITFKSCIKKPVKVTCE